MEPVGIDFIIGGNVDSEGKKIENRFERITEIVGDSRKKLRAAIKEQKQVIKELEAELKQLEKAYKKTAPGNAQPKVAKTIADLKYELKDAKSTLQVFTEDLEKSEQAHQHLGTKIRKLTDAMAKMEAAGKRNTPEFAALREEAAKLTNALGYTQKQVKILAHDNSGFQGLVSGLSGVSGAMSAGMGVVGLFNAENEKLAKIQTKLQSLMAITIGLQQAANTLNKDSSFRIVAVSKAKAVWTKSAALLNTQLGISIGLSKALMTGGIGLIIAGITAAIVAYQKWNEKQQEAARLQKQFIDLEKDTAKSMAKGKVEVEQLMRVAADQTKDLDTRNKAIKRLNELMPEYNGYLNSEGQLVANTEVALKDYLTTLYKVEKAKKMIAAIEEKDAEIGGKEAEPAEEVGFWKKAWAHWVAGQDQSGTLTADGLIKSMNDKLAEENEAAIQALRDEKKKMEEELSTLLGDTNVFSALFGGDTEKTTNKWEMPDLSKINEGYDEKAIIDQLQHQITLTDDENKKLELRNQIRDKELELIYKQIEAEKQRALAEAKEKGATKVEQQTIITTYETKKQNEEKAVKREKQQDAEKTKNELLLKELKNYEAYAQRVVAIEQWKQDQIAEINQNKKFSETEKKEKQNRLRPSSH